MRRPPGSVPGEQAATLLAVLALEHPTLPAVAYALRISKSSAYERLLNARDRGLVDFEDGKRGTLHARFRPVRFGRRDEP
jgi:DNA-binding IclR family transcriptional regulator